MSFSSSIHIGSSSVLRYVPFLTPAIKEYTYEIDRELLDKRLQLIAIATFASIAAITTFALKTLPLVTLMIPCTLLLAVSPFIDLWLTKRAIDRKAAQEFISMQFPTVSATNHIRGSYKTIKLLINRKGDLNKLNEQGQRILTNIYNFDCFKLLVDNGANVNLSDENRSNEPYVINFLSKSDHTYFEYLLKTRKVKVADYTSEQQARLWGKVGSIKAIYLLKQYGFDINAKNSWGETPLLSLIKRQSFSGRYGRIISDILDKNIGIQAHVAALLKCGANPYITINHENREKNAAQLNTNPVIKAVLEQHGIRS